HEGETGEAGDSGGAGVLAVGAVGALRFGEPVEAFGDGDALLVGDLVAADLVGFFGDGDIRLFGFVRGEVNDWRGNECGEGGEDDRASSEEPPHPGPLPRSTGGEGM